jgi:hypothetical protein
MFAKEMVAGAIGQIGIAIAIAFFIIIEYSYIGFTDFMFLSIIDTDILIISFVIHLAATTGVPRKSRASSSGTGGVAFGILTGFIYLALYVEGLLGKNWVYGYTYLYRYESYWYPTVAGLFLMFLSYLTFGVALAALGAFFLSCRKSFTPSQIWAAAGIAYLAAGVFQLTLLITDPSYMILVAAGIIGATCFLISKPKFIKKNES